MTRRWRTRSRRRQPRTKLNIKEELNNENFKSDVIFQEVYVNCVKLNKSSTKFSNRVLKKVILDRLIDLMDKANEKFKSYFKYIMYGGSFYKRLKVSRPNEYDLNIVIDLPVEILKVNEDRQNPGYIRIKVQNDKDSQDFCSKFAKEYYLDKRKFHDWMHRVIGRAVSKYEQKYGQKNYMITLIESGPAFTIKVTLKNDERNIDIDLVPCIICSGVTIQGFRSSEVNEWVAIGKPLKNVINDNIIWRPSFYKAEKKLLQGHIKPIIRMMKKFRDVRGWDNFKSYYIETLFLHELSNKDFKTLYPKASRTCIFIYMLRRLKEVLEDGWLSNYWNRNHNLLEESSSWQNMANCLTTILRALDNGSKTLEDYIF